MSPILDTDFFALSRTDPQTGGTYKTTFGALKAFLGAAIKPDWNAAPASPAGILNRPDAATSTTQGLMPAVDKAWVDQQKAAGPLATAATVATAQTAADAAKGAADAAKATADTAKGAADAAQTAVNDRVLRAGDTMTGTLKMADGNNWFQFGKEGGITGTSSGRETAFFYVETPDTDSDLKFRFQHWMMDPEIQKNATIESKQELKLFGKKVELFAEFSQTLDGPMYSFRADAAYWHRSLIMRPNANNCGIRLEANESNSALLEFKSRDNTELWGTLIASGNNNVMLQTPGNLTIQGGQTNGQAFVTISGGWLTADPIIFKSGDTSIASIKISGEYLRWSDIKAKRNISAVSYGLAEIMKLRPVSFQFNHIKGDAAPLSIGFIAQEAQQVIPEAVSKMPGDTGDLGICETTLIPVLVKAVQELAAQVEHLTNHVNTLTGAA